MDKSWFELGDVIRRRVADGAWVTLYGWAQTREGETGHVGDKAEYFGVHSAAVPLDQRDGGDALSWHTFREAGVSTYGGTYKAVDLHDGPAAAPGATLLVMRQEFDGAAPKVLHLHQDLVFALRLSREGDLWVRPSEGFAEVARLERDTDGHESAILIRTEYLRDYLAARGMALRVSTYRSRSAVLETADGFGWSAEGVRDERFGGRFEGRATPIHEGGFPFDAETAVFHMGRTDVDVGADVPLMGPPGDDSVEGRHWTFRRQGRKLYRIEGEYWRDEWVEPAAASPRVRGDEVPSEVRFITGAGGERESADALNDEDVGKWLWFRPDLIATILGRRGGELGWFTRDTGGVEMSAGGGVHFGVNEQRLLNTYARDVARLEEWERRVWSAFNVAPDGGVSQELLSAHVAGEPAHTKAPEAFLEVGLEQLDAAFRGRFGQPLLIAHPEQAEIAARCHRFRADGRPGLLALAKDLARLTADNFDGGALKAALSKPKGETIRTLRAVQEVLGSIIGETRARELCGPMVGVYELRLGDAHLPSSQLNASLVLAKNNPDLPWPHQGRDLISEVVTFLHVAAAALRGEAVTPEQVAERDRDAPSADNI